MYVVKSLQNLYPYPLLLVELGSSSIDVLIVAYSEPVGFADFNLIKENLIFNIMSIVKDNNSEFAFPSTSLYVESTPQSS